MEALLILPPLSSVLVAHSDKEQLWVSVLVVQAHRLSQPGAVAAGKHPGATMVWVLTQPPTHTAQGMVKLAEAAETLGRVSACDCGPT